MLNPEKFAHTVRLIQVQPYDPNKIPVVFVPRSSRHARGLGADGERALGLIPFCAGTTRCAVFSYPERLSYPVLSLAASARARGIRQNFSSSPLDYPCRS
jgi:hypothetical protein